MALARAVGRKVSGIVELIKFEHSIFALPFAMMALFMVYQGVPNPVKTLWIIICMVAARSASMSFNRIVDYEYDLKNPRTSMRPLQSGRVNMKEAWVFTVLMSILFIVSAAMLNRLAFCLSFVALPVLFAYSFTKRFTFLSHLVLGFTLGSSTIAVWIAVAERISLVSAFLCGGVTFWVAGFDIIYALQDREFDTGEDLKSIPVKFGAGRAVRIASLFHAVALMFFLLVGIAGGTGALYYGGLALIAFFLLYEHYVVRKYGLSRINMAFFTLNGIVSIVFFLFSVADILLREV
jgi:4-hydroxybenzoate polyprenyltransferase